MNRAIGATGYTLFGAGGPLYTDVAQGNVGDCGLLASFAETVARDPGAIKDMFIANGNGTWTVRFFIDGGVDYVTVNDQLPLSTVHPNWNGGFVANSPQNGVLWVALAEKAFAQENQTGDITTSQMGVASYAALEGGWASWVLPVITGRSSATYDVTYGWTADSIGEALQAGELVCIDTPHSGSIDLHLVEGHCYAVVGYDPSSSMPFTIFNPWGVNTYKNTGGQTWGIVNANNEGLEENFGR